MALKPDSASDRRLVEIETGAGSIGRATRRFLDYVDDLTGGTRWPRRREIRPEDMVGFLPFVFIGDIVSRAPLDIRYRLVGTGIADLEGECTGMLLSEIVPDRQLNARLWTLYEDALNGQIRVRQENLARRNREHVTYEVVVFPLLDDTDAITQVLGCASGY